MVRPDQLPKGGAALAAALVVALLAPSAEGAWAPNGVPIAPLATDQTDAAIAADPGGVFVAWVAAGPAGLSTHLQRLTPEGELAFGWPDSGLLALPRRENTTLITDGQGGVYVASDPALSSGAAMVTHITASGAIAFRWPMSLPNTIVGLAEDDVGPSCVSDGSSRRAGPERVQAIYQTFLPSFAMNTDGSVLICWMHSVQYTSFEVSDHVHLGRFKSNSEPERGWLRYGIPIGNDGMDPPHQFMPAMCGDDSGGAFVAYTHMWPWPTFVYVRRVVGNAERNEGRRLAPSSGHQEAVGMAKDGAGGAILVWQDSRAGFQQTYAQRVLPDLSVAPGWPADGLRLCSKLTRPGSMRYQLGLELLQSSVVADGDGGAFVVWVDLREHGATGPGDIYAQHVRGDGTLAPGWPEDGLAICRAPGDQSLPRVAPDGAGGAYLVWQDQRGDNADVYVQHVDSEGVLRWKGDGLALCDAAGAQERPVIASDDAGGAVVAWVDGRGNARNVYAARIPETQVPVLASLREAEATHDRVRLVWWVGGTDAGRVAIERRSAAGPWTELAQVAVESGGWVRFEDRAVEPQTRYAYRVSIGAEVSGETWIETPGAARLQLEGARPNPSSAGLVVSFELPDASPATLELIDATGRRIAERSVGGLGTGRHLIRVAETDLAPGLYFVRLTRGERTIVRRAAVTR